MFHVHVAIFMLSFSISGIIIFIILNARKLKLFRGQLFSNTVKIMLFKSDAPYDVPVNCVKLQETYISLKLQEN